jgi:CheY-like chemotaxis protein
MKIKNIFLADDDSDDIFLFREALKEVTGNVVVHVAENGDVLLKMLASQLHEPDLIFLDLNMPIKNGFQSLEEIRANNSYNNIPVAILSTTSDEKAIATAHQGGANAYITKPVAFADLKKIITKCLHMDWDNFEATELHTFVLKP